MPLAVDILTL